MKRLAVCVLLVLTGCSSGSTPHVAAPTPTVVAPTTAGPTVTVVPTPATAAPTRPSTAGPVGGPVPKGLTVSSVTFVSPQTGWVLGSAPCAKPPCTSIARTRDGGLIWRGVPAPAAPIDGGVQQLRFGNGLDGFAYGSLLFTTHDGGGHWKPLKVGGVVQSLEVGHGRWWAVVTGCTQAVGPCTTAGRLVTGRVGNDAFTTAMAVPAATIAQVVLHGSAVYLTSSRPDGGASDPLLFESAAGGTTFARRGMPCDDTEVPFVAAASDTSLALVCQSTDAGAGQQGKSFFTSANAGRTWTQHAKPSQIVGTTIAATPTAVYVGNSRTGVEVTRDGGRTWTQSLRTDAGADYVGFVSSTVGVAVDGQRLYLTHDAGTTWRPAAF